MSVTLPSLRRVVWYSALAVSGAAVAQTALLKATYVSPPASRGPLHGLEPAPSSRPLLLPPAAADLPRMLPAMVAPRDALQGLAARLRAALSSLGDGGGFFAAARRDAPRENPVVEKAAEVKPPVRVLYVGDSLVTGVGVSKDRLDASPPLPKFVSAVLARHWRRDVRWRALGRTGANLRGLRDALLPGLREEVAAAAAAGEAVAAVVVVCGVNDWKRCGIAVGEARRGFRAELGEFVREIRGIVGDEAVIVLPALPAIGSAPRFLRPLSNIVQWLCEAWDAEKKAIAEEEGGGGRRVHFVSVPSLEVMKRAGDVGGLFSPLDGIHPSDAGYRAWAEHIADSLQGMTRAAVAPAA